MKRQTVSRQEATALHLGVWRTKWQVRVRWNNQTILDEIRQLQRAGEELNFTRAEQQHPHLVRAAMWHFGSWKQAVEQAGFEYETVSRYRRWTRERLLETIRDHHQAGRDLSWRAVSTEVDPSLAAAALRPNLGFATWREALTAAGINHEEVTRYRHWTPERVIAEMRELARQGHPLSSKAMQQEHQALFCAALRRFDSWNGALRAAGLEAALPLRRRKTASRPGRARSTQRDSITGAARKRRHPAHSPATTDPRAP